MATPRSAGSWRVTSRPLMRTLPEEMRSSPAMARSSVDLPQPEGPTMTTNSPGSTAKLTPLMARNAP